MDGPRRSHSMSEVLVLEDLRDGLLADFVIRLRRLERSPVTVTYYRATVLRFLRHHRRLSLAQITGEHVERYLYERPLSPRSMSTELGVLRTFFRFLIRSKRVLQINPCDDVDKPRWREKPRPSPTLEDFRALLTVCQTDEERLLVTLPYVCGFRVSELRWIRYSDIETQKRRITVLGKGAKERTVPFPASVLSLLATAREDRDYLFPSRQWVHRPRQIRWIEETLRRLGVSAGLRYRLTCHVLRYGFTRLGRKAGLSLEEVSFLMGHADIRTTANVYHRLHIEDVQPGYIEKVEKLLDTQPPIMIR